MQSYQLLDKKADKEIIVNQDNSVLFEPTKGYYDLNPYFPRKGDKRNEPTQQFHALEQKATVSMISVGINACHTVIAYEESSKSCFMLHVSPHSYRKGYGSSPEESTPFSMTSFGMFGGFDMDAAMTEACKPAYICLDPTKYKEFTLPVNKDTKLKLIIVVNNQYWDQEKAKNIVAKIKSRTPATITAANIIVTEALDHGVGYSVSFNPMQQTLCVHGTGGIYNEHYSKPFIQTAHDHVDALLPKEKSLALKDELGDLFRQVEINSILKKMLGKPLHLTLSKNTSKLQLDSKKIEKDINAIERILNQSKNPPADFGSEECFDCYMRLGLFYMVQGNIEKASGYLARSADYATAQHRFEYDWLANVFSLLAGLAYKELGHAEKTLQYLLGCHIDQFFDLSQQMIIQSDIAELGKKVPGYEFKITKQLINMKIQINYSDQQSTEKAKWIDTCNTLLTGYADTIEKYRDQYDSFRQEYNQRAGLTMCNSKK